MPPAFPDRTARFGSSLFVADGNIQAGVSRLTFGTSDRPPAAKPVIRTWSLSNWVHLQQQRMPLESCSSTAPSFGYSRRPTTVPGTNYDKHRFCQLDIWASGDGKSAQRDRSHSIRACAALKTLETSMTCSGATFWCQLSIFPDAYEGGRNVKDTRLTAVEEFRNWVYY